MKNSSKKGILKTEPQKTNPTPKKIPLPDRKADDRKIIKTEPSPKKKI
ncbi:MAG: hypothetical protein JNM51_09315 [Bacteroidia bacterium]|nr:hypothetical protein [Bacteroidia bacterium]